MDIEPAAPRGEHTQAEIVSAAYRLFADHGYHGTSMRQIAQEAGIALGGIYNHFASKEELFLTVLLERYPLKLALPMMAAAQGTNIEEFVRDAASRMVAGFDDQRDFLNLMFIEMVEFKGVHLPRIFEKYLPELIGFTQRLAQGRDELRPLPVMVLLRAFLGLFFSYEMTELFLADQLPAEMMENALDYFIDIFLHGILADHPPLSEAA
jgi:AcrR family transcriptional regulator